MRYLLFSLVFFLSAPLFAQAYTPVKKAPADLIHLGTFSRPPVRLSDYELIDTQEVINGKRLDFQQTYNVQYWDMVENIEKSYKGRKAVSVLDPDLFPNARQSDLFVLGLGTKPNGATRITLGAKSLPYKFTIDITSDDQSRAVVTIHSTVRSIIYGGSHPARAPFRPVGVKPIKFRWE